MQATLQITKPKWGNVGIRLGLRFSLGFSRRRKFYGYLFNKPKFFLEKCDKDFWKLFVISGIFFCYELMLILEVGLRILISNNGMRLTEFYPVHSSCV